MTHIMTMFDSDFLYFYDLPSKEYAVEIDRVEQGEAKNSTGTKKMPFLYFVGHKKALGLNKTNTKTIVRLYGTEVEKWVGKRLTLYVTTVDAFGETVPCIRIKPEQPAAELKVAQ